MSHRARPAPIVIVGGGVAGSAVAIALREAGFRGRVVIVSDESALPYRRSPLSTAYLRAEVGRDELLVRPAGWYRDAGVDLILGATATRVDRSKRLLDVQGHGPLAYDRLVLATGTGDRCPPLRGAHRVRSTADADALRRVALPGRRAVVVGAGYAGGEIASSLAVMGLSVTLLEARSTPVSELGEEAGAWLANRARAAGIELLVDSAALSVVVAGGRGLVRTAGSTLRADLVVDARGSVARSRLAETAGLLVDDGVRVDGRGRTTDDRIFAAGAVARPLDQTTRAHDDVSAQASGAAVARSLLGLPAPPTDVAVRSAELFGGQVTVIGVPGIADVVWPLGAAAGPIRWGYGRDGRLVAVAGQGTRASLDRFRDPVRSGAPLDAAAGLLTT